MDMFISSTTINIFMWYQNQRYYECESWKIKKHKRGYKKLVRLLLGFKVILLHYLKVIEVPHSSGHIIKANDKEMGKKVITLNTKYILTKKK